MLQVQANQISKDEYGINWATINEELFEVFTPDEDQNEQAMIEAGYTPISLTLGDISPKHAGTVYESDRLFIKQ
jgi:hypothetical protein